MNRKEKNRIRNRKINKMKCRVVDKTKGEKKIGKERAESVEGAAQ